MRLHLSLYDLTGPPFFDLLEGVEPVRLQFLFDPPGQLEPGGETGHGSFFP